MKIQTSKIEGKSSAKSCEVVNIYLNDDKEKSKTLTDLASGGVTAFATNQTWDAFKASNTFTRDDYIKKLSEYGISSQKAPQAADQIIEVVNQGWTKPLLVAVSTTGAAYAVLEAVSAIPGTRFSKWSRLKKFVVSLIVGLVVAGVYAVLRNYGVFA